MDRCTTILQIVIIALSLWVYILTKAKIKLERINTELEDTIDGMTRRGMK